MNEANPTVRQASADTLFGGRSMRIRLKDNPRRKVPFQVVQVLALPLSQVPAMLDALEDEHRLLCLYLDMGPEDVDQIHPDSVAEALRIGDEINLAPFAESRARTQARLLRFAGAVSELQSDAPSATCGASGATRSPRSASGSACHGGRSWRTLFRSSKPC